MDTTARPAARTRATRTFAVRLAIGVALYVGGLSLASVAEGTGFPAWIPALLILPAVALMAWANVEMYRSGDEFERRKIAEAVMFAFVVSTALILAVGFLQFVLLPALNWIFAFSVLMLAWAAGTVIAALRHR